MLASPTTPTKDELVDELCAAFERLGTQHQRKLITTQEYANALALAVLPLHQQVMRERGATGVTIWHADATRVWSVNG